ncbi:MAG: MFS transporter [Gammaproteobacteria bacterium]|nr:MFS transporter [Gammaproteobacteria bacterium]
MLTPPLSFNEKFSYALGDTASNLFFQFFSIFIIYYYTDVYGLSAAAVTTMLLTVKLWDWITDPVMGIIADRTNTRWGKFRPYLLWMAIPYGALGYLMFINPDLQEEGKLIFAYITYILMMTAYTAINVPYGAMMGVMTTSSSERLTLGTYRFVGAFSAAILLGMSVRPLVRILGGEDELLGFQYTMAIFAVLSILLFLQTFRGTKERVSPPPNQDNHIGRDLSALIKNKAWLVMVVAGIFTLASVAIRGAATVYFFKYYMLDDNSPFIWIWDRTSFFITVGAIVFVIGVIAGRFLSNVYDKRTLMLFLMLSNAIVMGLMFYIPNDYYWTMLAVNALASLLAGPTPALVWAMYGDVADYGEWKFKRRTTALVFSAAQFAQKLGLTIGGVLPTAVLAYVGYEANVAQSETAMMGIRLIFTWLPALFSIVAGLAFIFYPLRDFELVQIEKDLVDRRLEYAL